MLKKISFLLGVCDQDGVPLIDEEDIFNLGRGELIFPPSKWDEGGPFASTSLYDGSNDTAITSANQKTFNNRFGGKISMYEMKPTWKMHEIDTVEDLELCEYYARKYLFQKDNAPKEDL